MTGSAGRTHRIRRVLDDHPEAVRYLGRSVPVLSKSGRTMGYGTVVGVGRQPVSWVEHDQRSGLREYVRQILVVLVERGGRQRWYKAIGYAGIGEIEGAMVESLQAGDLDGAIAPGGR